MKTTLSIAGVALSLVLPYHVMGQSSFRLQNIGFGVDAPVSDSQGVRLEGGDYLAELYWGNSPDSLTPVLTFYGDHTRVPFSSGLYAGYFVGTQTSVVWNSPRGGWAWLRVRAWDARLGATYEEASSRGLGGYGESPLFYAQGGDPLDLLSPIPGSLIGLQSFSLLPMVPEPGSVLLLFLGLPLLLWHRRRLK